MAFRFGVARCCCGGSPDPGPDVVWPTIWSFTDYPIDGRPDSNGDGSPEQYQFFRTAHPNWSGFADSDQIVDPGPTILNNYLAQTGVGPDPITNYRFGLPFGTGWPVGRYVDVGSYWYELYTNPGTTYEAFPPGTQKFESFFYIDEPTMMSFFVRGCATPGSNTSLPGLYLDQGATITSAVFRSTVDPKDQPFQGTAPVLGENPGEVLSPFYTYDCSLPRTLRLRFYGEAVDNPVDDTQGFSGQDLIDAPRTTAFVDWELEPALDGSPDCRDFSNQDMGDIDITPILQELVNRPGWTHNSSFRLIAVDNGSDRGIGADFNQTSTSTRVVIESPGWIGSGKDRYNP